MGTSLQNPAGTQSVAVDATSSGLIVQNPKVLAQAGFSNNSALIDAGAVTGSALARAIRATAGGRAEVSQLTPLFTDTFNYTAQDTARWSMALTTFAVTYASGFVTMNSAAVTTANAVAVMKSYFTYPIPTEGMLVFRMFGTLTQVPQANNTVEFGFLYAATTAAPTDGLGFFRFDSTGTLKGVINYNGTETTTAALTAPAAGTVHIWQVVADESHAEFWIDGVLQATLNSGTSTGQPQMSGAVQALVRTYNGASTPSIAQQVKISDIDIWQTDGQLNRPSAFVRCEMGMMGYQGVGGQAMGSTANFANSSNPAPAVPTNTTAALGTGLGGQFWETTSIAVNTDGIICSFQVPAATVNITGRKLVITGIRWKSIVQTVLAGGPFVYQCGLAFGHTSVSLATAEAATTKAPRRLALDLCTLPATAAVGSIGTAIAQTFSNPIVVNPGEFVACFVKNIGTVGSSGTIAHAIAFDAHWE